MVVRPMLSNREITMNKGGQGATVCVFQVQRDEPACHYSMWHYGRAFQDQVDWSCYRLRT